jgi:hypothetical protein
VHNLKGGFVSLYQEDLLEEVMSAARELIFLILPGQGSLLMPFLRDRLIPQRYCWSAAE